MSNLYPSLIPSSVINPVRAVRMLEMVIVFVLAVSLAGLFWELNPAPETTMRRVTSSPVPITESGGGVNKANGIEDNPLSPAVKSLFGPPPDMTAALEKSVRETQLDLTLKGVLAHRRGRNKFALIARGEEDEQVYKPGDRISGAQLVDIEARRVILKRNDRYESLTLDAQSPPGWTFSPAESEVKEPGSVHRVGENRHVISRDTLQQQLDNLPRLLSKAEAVPYKQDGEPAGFRIVNIQAGSVFQDLGLQHQDIIRSINGISVRNPREAAEAYRTLKTAEAFRLNLTRGGREVTIDYSLR